MFLENHYLFTEMELMGGARWGVVCLVLVLAGVAGVGVSVPLALQLDARGEQQQRLKAAQDLLKSTPLIDG